MRSREPDTINRALDDARAFRYRADTIIVVALALLVATTAALDYVAAAETRRVAVVRLSAGVALALTLVGRVAGARRDCESVVVATEYSLVEPTLALALLTCASLALDAAIGDVRRYGSRLELALTTLTLGTALGSAHWQWVTLSRASALLASVALAWPAEARRVSLSSLVLAEARLLAMFGAHFVLMWRVDGRLRAERVVELGTANMRRVSRSSIELVESHVGKLGWMLSGYAPALLVFTPALLALDAASRRRAIQTAPSLVK